MNKFSSINSANHNIANRFNSDILAKIIIQLKKHNKLNKVFSRNLDKKGIEFVDAVLSALGIKLDVSEQDLDRIPKTGAFITVSNSPLGGIEYLLLLKLVLTKRPDFKILTEPSFHKITPLNELSIPIKKKISFSSSAFVTEHIQNESPIGIFPAMGQKTYHVNTVGDGKWKNSVIKFIKFSKVPIVPIYFNSKKWSLNFLNSAKFSLLTKSFGNKTENKPKLIKVRIGKPIKVKEQEEFVELSMFSRFLRVKTYALGTKLKVNNFFRSKFAARVRKEEKIIDPIKKELIIPEIDLLKKQYHLFDSNEYSIICAPSTKMPNILLEIGRLREITFREIGEGTNRSLDLDEFDLYFNQLVIWDNNNEKIVGAYRVGRGDEIMQQYGVKGFYLQSLFKIKKGFQPILKESIELGRSFVVKEYQRKPFSLFLLWKGILYFLLKNRQYRYLLGPASISNNFSKFSQSLIVDFFKANYFDEKLTSLVAPRKEFKIKTNSNFHKDIFIKSTSKDVKKLDKFIQDIEPEYSTPVLFKKYIQLNAKLLGFNVDPKFNNCVDGLMILDIYDVPINTLQSLSKELEDDSILERFNF